MIETNGPTVLSLFCGIGGQTLGFLRAGFTSVGAVDCDAQAIEDFEALTGSTGTVGDLELMSPDELRALAGPRRPDVVVLSPPCKGFSGCLPRAHAAREKYQRLNALTLRGIWLALLAWESQPPPLLIMENVPRIQSAGRQWLDRIKALLGSYGYASRETTYDCGEFGALAQSRRRFMLVARHRAQIPDACPLFVPVSVPLRGMGEVLSMLPVPTYTAEGMHRLPKLSALNHLRLAAIPAGKDWRALPAQISMACAPRRSVMGVAPWDDPLGVVTGSARVDNGAFATADPRVTCSRREGSMGVKAWQEPSTAIIGHCAIQNHPCAVADPRLGHDPRGGSFEVQRWDESSKTVIGDYRICKGAAVADPRLPDSSHRHSGKYGVEDWQGPAHTIIGEARTGKAWAGVSDPRLPERAGRQNGQLGVNEWSTSAHTVVGHATPKATWSSVNDPRGEHAATHELVQTSEGLVLFGPGLDLESRTPAPLVIRAPDGTWHRPLTTLELFALQGFETHGRSGTEVLLAGKSQSRWRMAIGNAVPPPAAEAIARSMMRTLRAASGGLLLGCDPIWVEQPGTEWRALQ